MSAGEVVLAVLAPVHTQIESLGFCAELSLGGPEGSVQRAWGGQRAQYNVPGPGGARGLSTTCQGWGCGLCPG